MLSSPNRCLIECLASQFGRIILGYGDSYKIALFLHNAALGSGGGEVFLGVAEIIGRITAGKRHLRHASPC
jgi:hypothetical protein